jgi:PRC-barrel domain
MPRAWHVLPAVALVLAAAPASPPASAQTHTPATAPPAAGEIPLGVTVIEMRAVVTGWSAKRDLLGKTVQNDKKQNLGKIEDVIVAPSNSVSFAIIGVGGFLGIASRLVAIPMKQLKLESGALVLPGATKENLTAMPPFVYAH